LLFKERAPISFDALVGGAVTLEIDGITVLRGEGTTVRSQVAAKAPFARPPGLYRLVVRYRSLPGVPARLQIGWQAPSFGREPLPAWLFKHVPAELPHEAAQEQQAAVGRELVGRLRRAPRPARGPPPGTHPPPGPAAARPGRP